MSVQPLDFQHYTFLGLPHGVAESEVVIVPVQYDGTASNKKGTAFGPRRIILESYQLEEYVHPLRANILKNVKIATHPELAPLIYPYDMICRIEETALDLLQKGRFVFGLGGDHSVSNGFIRAQKKVRSNSFTVLHFDAHTDFRDEWQGSIWSHACVMRRVSDWRIPIVQVGIRSTTDEIEAEEKKRKDVTVFYIEDRIFTPGYDLQFMAHAIVNSIKTKDVYVTIDVDCFNTGGNTGTSEPDALTWRQGNAILCEVARYKNVIGADLVEFRDGGEETASRAFDMAKLIYWFLTAIYLKKNQP